MNASDAVTFLCNNRELRNASVTEPITFIESVEHEIHCTNCHFDSFCATFAHFKRPVQFVRCTFQRCDFYAAYFFKGLYVSACEFNTGTTFQSGGHNPKDCEFAIRDSVFHDFVDFEDCSFEGPVIIENVDFRAGTNLLGNLNTPMQVLFDYEPIIINTQGPLRLNTFGQLPT